jgi:hypothetical protein
MQDWFIALSGEVLSIKDKGVKSLAIMVCWTIWCERNARIFTGKERSMPRFITDMKDEARQWFRAGAKFLGPIVCTPSCE